MSFRALAPRIDAQGVYHSPNVCFIGPEDEDDHGSKVEADEADEGAEESDEDGLEDAGGEEGDEDGGEEDEASAGDEEGETEKLAEETPRRRAGASEVIRSNKASRKEAERRAAELERRVEAAERRAEAAERAATERRQTESKEARDARLALMSPEERFEALRNEDRETYQRELSGVRFEVWNTSDKSEFRQLVREDPLVASVQKEVEAEFQRIVREKGPAGATTRETIATYLVGKLMREKGKTAGTKQRQRAQDSVRRETTRPVRTRSDVASTRTRRGQEDTAEARKRRLENVTI